MNLRTIGFCAAALIATTPALAQQMEISPNGSRSSFEGPADYFTGNVIVDMLFPPNAETPTSGAYVTFAPGARSAWHSHPAGQTLVVTSGTGWVQQEGGAKREIRPGDVIWTPPGVKHWHGATPTASMQHTALTNVRDGENVEWMEQVTDAQYGAE
ncbi:cupin domain-containing protein [Marinibaculum pumilum]|uniref:Cupin domain-containing protein n=1 Tax=Marinibaculum pumilum TaxID=1766165 RepID=A0ABV7L265_9PROT